ncbi:MAG: iduronate-2-sulfatase, partial [Bacteroidales bacterium]|nr:iduronate-2-sulfatase [Bacteroidales bacterium]
GDNAVDQRFNYAEWLWNGQLHARMLFDHEIDPEENRNRAEEPEYEDDINDLSSYLKVQKKISEKEL